MAPNSLNSHSGTGDDDVNEMGLAINQNLIRSRFRRV